MVLGFWIGVSGVITRARAMIINSNGWNSINKKSHNNNSTSKSNASDDNNKISTRISL